LGCVSRLIDRTSSIDLHSARNFREAEFHGESFGFSEWRARYARGAELPQTVYSAGFAELLSFLKFLFEKGFI